MPITYTRGDATKPVGEGVKIIPHCVNTVGGWGAGFVLALSKRWRAPESRYRKWFREGTNAGFELGATQLVLVEEEPDQIWVANMVAQVGYIRKNQQQEWTDGTIESPIRYEALEKCFATVAEQAVRRNASIHMPRVGAGLARGDWPTIEKIVEKTLKGLSVTVYDLSKSSMPPKMSNA